MRFESVDYPEDVIILKEKVTEIKNYNAIAVEYLWAAFSTDVYCASHMGITKNLIDEFQRWLVTGEV